MTVKGRATCGESWGDAADQECVREWRHYGVHIDAKGREWGYVPNERNPW